MWWYQLFGFVFRITWLPALCFILGFAFSILEIFTPGFGAAGISGIVFLILGVMFTARSLLDALIIILIVFIVVGGSLFLIMRSASKGKLQRKLILSDRMDRESGYLSRNEPNSLLGKEGTAITMLRPTGIIDIDGVKFDVVSDGGYLPKGTNVKVSKVEGMRIVVSEYNHGNLKTE